MMGSKLMRSCAGALRSGACSGEPKGLASAATLIRQCGTGEAGRRERTSLSRGRGCRCGGRGGGRSGNAATVASVRFELLARVGVRIGAHESRHRLICASIVADGCCCPHTGHSMEDISLGNPGPSVAGWSSQRRVWHSFSSVVQEEMSQPKDAEANASVALPR